MKKEIPNCQACDDYNCKQIRENGGYKYWGCLLGWRYGNRNKIHGRTTALEKKLMKAAQEFLPEYTMFWQGVYCCKAPYGSYVWHFAVKMRQYRLWNLREFQEGYSFGLNPVSPHRAANPYSEPERKSTWDCGYIYGLYERAERKDHEI